MSKQPTLPPPPTKLRPEYYRRSRLTGAYFLVQSISIAAWWALLLYAPNTRQYFRTSRMTDTALLDFIWPDLFFLGIGSGVCGWALWKNPQSSFSQACTWVIVGATCYPTAYVCGATYMSNGQGWAATLFMLFAATGSFLAAWSARVNAPLFRVSPERSSFQYILRTLMQTSVFWAVSLVLGPWLFQQAEKTFHLPRFETPFQSWLPILFFIIFGLLNLYTGYIMSSHGKGTPLPLETARLLVIQGPYRYVRNPMAMSGLLLGLMVAWWLGSWLTLLTVFAGGFIWHYAVRPIEEKDLERRFGQAYVNYKDTVNCWIPIWPPIPAVNDKQS